MQQDAFNLMTGTDNMRLNVAYQALQTSGIVQGILTMGRVLFEDELAKEATWFPHNQPHQVHFTDNMQWGIYIHPM